MGAFVAGKFGRNRRGHEDYHRRDYGHQAQLNAPPAQPDQGRSSVQFDERCSQAEVVERLPLSVARRDLFDPGLTPPVHGRMLLDNCVVLVKLQHYFI